MTQTSGLLPKVLLEAQAVAAGIDPDQFIAERLAAAASTGFDVDDPDWRQAWESWTPPDPNALPAHALPAHTPPAVPATATEPSTLTGPTLPTRRRTPPPKPAPLRPKRPDPLAIRFARQVLDDPPTPTVDNPEGWERLERPVSRSIVSKKAREWAEAYGVRFKVREDLIDPDNPELGSRHFLFCRIAEPHTVELDG